MRRSCSSARARASSTSSGVCSTLTLEEDVRLAGGAIAAGGSTDGRSAARRRSARRSASANPAEASRAAASCACPSAGVVVATTLDDPPTAPGAGAAPDGWDPFGAVAGPSAETSSPAAPAGLTGAPSRRAGGKGGIRPTGWARRQRLRRLGMRRTMADDGTRWERPPGTARPDSVAGRRCRRRTTAAAASGRRAHRGTPVTGRRACGEPGPWRRSPPSDEPARGPRAAAAVGPTRPRRRWPAPRTPSPAAAPRPARARPPR